MKHSIRTGPPLNVLDIYKRPDEGRDGGARPDRARVRASRKRVRDEFEGESLTETEDAADAWCSKNIDVAVQTSLSGDIIDCRSKQIELELGELKTKVCQLAPEEDISVKVNRLETQIEHL